VTTRLPPDLVERLDALGKSKGITRSFAARRAIETGLQKLQPKDEGIEAGLKRRPKV
jgi:predicted transcriptional regulator